MHDLCLPLFSDQNALSTFLGTSGSRRTCVLLGYPFSSLSRPLLAPPPRIVPGMALREPAHQTVGSKTLLVAQRAVSEWFFTLTMAPCMDPRILSGWHRSHITASGRYYFSLSRYNRRILVVERSTRKHPNRIRPTDISEWRRGSCHSN